MLFKGRLLFWIKRYLRGLPLLGVLLTFSMCLFYSQSVSGASKSSQEQHINAPKGQLKEVERELIKARALRKNLLRKTKSLGVDIKEIRVSLIAGARSIQKYERWVEKLKRELSELKKLKSTKEKSLSKHRERNGLILVGLNKLSQIPTEALLVKEIAPGDAIRSAVLLRSTVRSFQREIIALQQDLEELNRARRQAEVRGLELSLVTVEMQNQRKVMRTLMGRKSRLRRRLLTEQRREEKRIKMLVRQATSIRELMTKLEGLRKENEFEAKPIVSDQNGTKNKKKAKGVNRPQVKPMKVARGQLLLPVVGRVISKFGEKGKAGATHKGLTIITGLGAQVVAPYDGRVAFAGQFRGYGELIIIEHSESYHTLLSGMGYIDSRVGQWLHAGEPVGRMTGEIKLKPKSKPLLYLEMRHDGKPINPSPWLAVNRFNKGKRKVSG